MKRTGLHTLATLILLCSPLLNAQEKPTVSLHVSLSGNQLVARGQLINVIDEEMKASLSSGLSSTLNFYFSLISEKKENLRSKREIVRLRYNVWEKVFDLNTGGPKRQFDTFEAMEVFIRDSLEFKLGSVARLRESEKLRLVTTFSPQSISDSQKDQLDRWLSSEGSVDESRPAYDSDPGFSINLSSLLSAFFRRNENRNVYIFKSRPFTIHSLRDDEDASR